ncbi:MAG: ubiquitin-like small modifier protein 1 [Bacillota bacterium]|nr:ubiquitin-like small modifier protein 1 [Bacillota bacterium]
MIIKVFANLRDICGGVTVEVIPQGNRVMDILEVMIKRFPDLENEILTSNKTLKPFVHVYINGQNIIHADGLETHVHLNDQIAIFPPVAGG